MTDSKRCKKCGMTKSIDQLYRANSMRGGYRSECKNCNLDARHEWYRENREVEIARVKRWAAQNPERVRARIERDKGSAAKKVRDRKSHLKRAHGLTLEEYEGMLAEQGGGCAICMRKPGDKISLHVDHDHETGAIRGILCFRCNNALGDLDDDPSLLLRAAQYLTEDDDVDELVALARQRARALVS